MILALQQLLREKPWLRDFDAIQAEMQRAFDAKLKALEDRLINRLDSAMEGFQREIRAKLMSISDMSEITNRLSNVEEATHKTSMGLGEVQQQVRTIATCYCHVSKPTIYLI
jgi:hypothetical protein